MNLKQREQLVSLQQAMDELECYDELKGES